MSSQVHSERSGGASLVILPAIGRGNPSVVGRGEGDQDLEEEVFSDYGSWSRSPIILLFSRPADFMMPRPTSIL